MRNHNLHSRSQGTILIITLWILTLLSAIAVSLTYRMSMELKMSSNELNRDRVFSIAKAGVVQAVSVLNKDDNGYDSLNERWSNYSAEMYRVNLFKDIFVGDGKFNVSYVYESDIFTGNNKMLYGMQDEERKININKAEQNVLESLPGMSPEIALSIRAWRGDAKLAQEPDVLSKEDAYYQALDKPYKRKGKDFECIEELSLVHGITPDMLYGKDLNGDGVIDVNEQGLIKYLTIYGDGLVNINTADMTVLRAIGFTEDLVYRIMRFRLGYDETLGTADDGVFGDVGNIADSMEQFEPLMSSERELISQKQPLLTVKSRYYTAYVEGSISDNVKSRVTAVIDKESEEGNQIVRWSEE